MIVMFHVLASFYSLDWSYLTWDSIASHIQWNEQKKIILKMEDGKWEREREKRKYFYYNLFDCPLLWFFSLLWLNSRIKRNQMREISWILNDFRQLKVDSIHCITSLYHIFLFFHFILHKKKSNIFSISSAFIVGLSILYFFPFRVAFVAIVCKYSDYIHLVCFKQAVRSTQFKWKKKISKSGNRGRLLTPPRKINQTHF